MIAPSPMVTAFMMVASQPIQAFLQMRTDRVSIKDSIIFRHLLTTVSPNRDDYETASVNSIELPFAWMYLTPVLILSFQPVDSVCRMAVTYWEKTQHG